jgi:hypothetical protein
MSKLVVAVATATAAIGATAEIARPTAPAPVNWSRLHRPLLPAALNPDGSCPTAPVAATVSDRPIVGRYPVFLFIVGDAAAGEVKLGPADATGWRGQKTPWLTSARYRGPLLVRAKQIDAAGDVAFANGYGQHLRELRFISNRDSQMPSEVGAVYFHPGVTLFRQPGCYALQVDGKHFTRQVIVRVVGD